MILNNTEHVALCALFPHIWMDHMFHYSGTSTIRGAMYCEWRSPKVKLGALNLVEVTWEERNVSEWMKC